VVLVVVQELIHLFRQTDQVDQVVVELIMIYVVQVKLVDLEINRQQLLLKVIQVETRDLFPVVVELVLVVVELVPWVQQEVETVLLVEMVVQE
jgi:hypothetical protein